jgi:uncharacterized membrane protein
MGLAIGGETLYELGIIIFLSSIKSGRARGGRALIIGPFPIVFGSDKESVKTILWLSIALTVLLFIVSIVLYLLGR